MNKEAIFTSWPLWVVVVPLLGALFAGVSGKYSAKLRNFFVVLSCFITLVLTFLMYKVITEGTPLVYNLKNTITPLGLTFRVDGLSFLVALVSIFVWFAATLYSLEYIKGYKNQGRYYVLLLLTLAGTVGVPLAGDLLTLLLFFEVMSLASYALVVHTQTGEAYEAGDIYLYMGVFGGLCLFAGIGLLYYLTGSMAIIPDTGAFSGLSIIEKYIIATLLITGFGIKAGMAPLHIWLPKAHPVAPAPASALLSGIMIKTGAYGIIRVLVMIMSPDSQVFSVNLDLEVVWSQISGMGLIMIWMGTITMFFGVCMALIQENAKKMLACHSISQMGYILMGIGAAAYLGVEGGMGLAGSTYHIINHALFKSLLFLVVGMVYLKTHELNMYELGGLWRKLPFTAVVGLIAALGIAGFPGLNGYASKTLLHHAILDAIKYGDSSSLLMAERIFTITAAGTACSFIKLYALIFLGKQPEKYNEIKRESLAAKIGMGIIALAIILLGVFPHLFTDNVLVPTLNYFVMDSYFLEGHILGINLFTVKDLYNVAVALMFGTIIYVLGMKSGIFHAHLPKWLGEEFLAHEVSRAVTFSWQGLTGFLAGIFLFIKKIGRFIYNIIFRVLYKIDYKPGQSAIFKRISFTNLDFDILIVMIMLGVILSVAFYIQFGITAIAP